MHNLARVPDGVGEWRVAELARRLRCATPKNGGLGFIFTDVYAPLICRARTRVEYALEPLRYRSVLVNAVSQRTRRDRDHSVFAQDLHMPWGVEPAPSQA